MRKKTYKLAKLEKNRKSIMSEDLEHCILCGAENPDINEIFMGRNRQNSMKYGLTIPLCNKHHHDYHNNRTMQLYWMEKAKELFIKLYSEDEWFNTFRYIKK